MTDSVKLEEATTPLTKETQTEATIPSPIPTTKLSVVPNWKQVFKTYSFWFYVSSILITLVDQILPLLGMLEPVMTGSTYIVVVFCLNLLGVIARFVQQKSLWKYNPEAGKDA